MTLLSPTWLSRCLDSIWNIKKNGLFKVQLLQSFKALNIIQKNTVSPLFFLIEANTYFFSNHWTYISKLLLVAESSNSLSAHLPIRKHRCKSQRTGTCSHWPWSGSVELAFLLRGDLAILAVTTCVLVEVTGFQPPVPRSKQQGLMSHQMNWFTSWNLHTSPAAVAATLLCEEIGHFGHCSLFLLCIED